MSQSVGVRQAAHTNLAFDTSSPTEMTLGHAENTEFRLHRKLWLALKHSQRKKVPNLIHSSRLPFCRQDLSVQVPTHSLGQSVQHVDQQSFTHSRVWQKPKHSYHKKVIDSVNFQQCYEMSLAIGALLRMGMGMECFIIILFKNIFF